MNELNPGHQRWWIRPPMPDETLRSVIIRAAALYECSPMNLWEYLNMGDPQSFSEMESPSNAALRRMAIAIGVSAPALAAHRLSDAPWLLAPQATEEVYCPMCWFEDQRQGNPFWIRRSWKRVLRTRCPDHGYPLCLAPEHWATSPLSHSLQLTELTENEQQILDLIESFGEILELSLYSGRPWPRSLKGNPGTARQLLLAASFNVNKIRDLPLTKYVQTSLNLTRYIHGPLHWEEPVKKLRWDAYRSISDPAIRRAGLWVTAWELTPEHSDNLSPGWDVLPVHIKDIMHHLSIY